MKTTIIKTIQIAAVAAVLLALGACSNMLTDLENTDDSISNVGLDKVAIEGPVYEDPKLTARHTYSSDALGKASRGEIQAVVPTSTDFSSFTPLDAQELPALGEQYELNMTAAGSLAAGEIIYTAGLLANDENNDSPDPMYIIKNKYDLSSNVSVDKPETGINFLAVGDGGAEFKLFSTDSDDNVVAEALWVYADGEAVIGGPGYTQVIGNPSYMYPTTSEAEVSVHVELEKGWNRLVHEYTWNEDGDAIESASVTIDSERDLSWVYSPIFR